MRVLVLAPYQMPGRVLYPLRPDLRDGAQVDALGRDALGGNDPTRAPLREPAARKDRRAGTVQTFVSAVVGLFRDVVDECGNDRAMHLLVARVSRREAPAEAEHERFELMVHVFPFAKPRQREESLLAPSAQRFRSARALGGIRLPKLEQRREVGALVRELRVLLPRRAEIVDRLLAGIDDAERGREHEPLAQRVLPIGREQQARKAR